MVPVTTAFSWSTAIWSLFVVGVVALVIWIKMHLLRMEIHTLVQKLPNLGSEFIRKEISEVRRDLDVTIARVRLCEKRQGFNGEDA